jgi:hypothetical protein
LVKSGAAIRAVTAHTNSEQVKLIRPVPLDFEELEFLGHNLEDGLGALVGQGT